MKLSKLPSSILILFTSLLLIASSQEKTEEGGTDFLFPINPGVQNYLAGTMGELRPNHFHAGIDVKTFGKINLPIYAIQDGFVSRIKVSRYGYGKVVYIEHPNGYTSVYAHLNKFSDALEKYITEKQYEKEVFEIELFPPSDKFTFKRGEVIAYSGNTGGSTGPHLHFEIRDINQEPLNPLAFHFEEIKDKVAPTFNELALKPLSLNARINYEFERKELRCKRTGRSKYDAGIIEASGWIGLEVDCFDRLDEMPNKNGVPDIKVVVNKDTIFHYKMDHFSFYETKCINQLIDYPVYRSKGVRFQKCYVDDGNTLDNYRTNDHKGKLYIQPDSVYYVTVLLTDAHENQATLSLKIKGKPPKKMVNFSASNSHVTPRYTLFNNILMATFPYSEDTIATLYSYPNNITLIRSYVERNKAIFLYDLNQAIPDSLTYKSNTLSFNFDSKIIPQKRVSYFYDKMIVDFYETTLFDTLFVSPEVTDQYVEINSEKIPLKNGINITIKDIDTSKVDDHTQAYQIGYNGYPSYVGGELDKKKMHYKFYTKELGKYALIKDEKPPVITYIRHNSQTIVLRVSDNLSGIGSVKATLNGKWLLMEYDKHILTAKFKEENYTFAGDFEIEVSDNAGNITTFNKKI